MWVVIRLAGIVVGIATLLRVATNEGIVTYDPLFLAWMDRLRDIVELGFLTDLIGPFLHWAIDQVRSLGISVPDLQDEWRPAFVLSTLMFGAVARHSRSGGWLFVAPVGALAAAVWSGLTGSLVPVAALVFTTAYGVAAFATVFAIPPVTTFATNLASILAGLLVVVLAFGMFSTFAAATLVTSASAVFLVLNGIGQSWGDGLRALLANALFCVGIDILFTMAFAFVIAVAAANPPI